MNPTLYNLWLFGRTLRTHGFSVGIDDMQRIMIALNLAEPRTWKELYETLQPCVVRSHMEQQLFGPLFAAFFGLLAGVELDEAKGGPWLLGLAPADPRTQQVTWLSLSSASRLVETPATVFSHAGRASQEERHGKLRPPDDIGQYAAMNLLPHWFRSPRRKRTLRGPYWDISKTLRKGLEQGELIRIWHRRRTMRERRTVILWDTSRSMESITPMLFNFLHNLVKQRQVKVLSFSTQLTVVTPQLLNSSPEYALNALYEAAQDIHGGTRLQNAVDIAVRKYSRWLGQRTDVILLTDGFESGDIKTLSASIKALRRRCKRVVWWNPWASRPGYSYDTHSGQVIKQHVDLICSAGNFGELRDAWNVLG